MKRFFPLLVLGFATTSACYHATIDTGRAPSPQTIEKHWANGWILGLVPPSTIETASQCPSGVAKVETQLSFPNQLVSLLTGGIYTPMDVKVTCAQGGSADLTTIKSGPDRVAALEKALEVSLRVHKPVLVQY